MKSKKLKSRVRRVLKNCKDRKLNKYYFNKIVGTGDDCLNVSGTCNFTVSEYEYLNYPYVSKKMAVGRIVGEVLKNVEECIKIYREKRSDGIHYISEFFFSFKDLGDKLK